MSIQAHFHDIPSRDALGADKKYTRQFIGNGTSIIETPFLTKVEKVWIDHQEIPLERVDKVPTDTTGTRFEDQTIPMVKLDVLGDGTPVLLRSTVSNHGVWQKDAIIMIEGDWSDDPKPKKKEKADEAAPPA